MVFLLWHLISLISGKPDLAAYVYPDRSYFPNHNIRYNLAKVKLSVDLDNTT